MWIDDIIEDEKDTIETLESNLNTHREDLANFTKHRGFWEKVEQLGIDTDILNNLYQTHELTEEALIKELEGSLKYYENIYDSIEYNDSTARVVVSMIEQYEKWINAVSNF